MWEGWLRLSQGFLEVRSGWVGGGGWGWPLAVSTGSQVVQGSVWDQESGVGAWRVDVTEDVLCASPYDLLFPLPSHSCD